MVAEASRERKAITTVTSFAPRQVVLLNRSMKQKSEAGAVENGSEAKERKSEKKRRKELRRMGPLLLSVAAFLDRKGLSSTLSALQSEGSIEVDSWKTDPFNLEDMYSDFCTAREKLATATANDSKKQGSKKDETSKKDNEEKDHNIKRKDVVEEDAVTERISSMTEGEILKSDLNNGSCDMEEAASVSKEEKKRKKKKSSEYRGDEIEQKAADMGGLNNEDHLGDPSAKSKEKKKKNKPVLDFEKTEKDPKRGTLDDGKRLDSECPKSASNGMEQDGTILKSKEKKKRKEKSENDVDMKKSDENGVDVKNKEQKKRKRSESDKQDSLSDDHFVDKDKPVKKTDGFDDKKAIKKHELESQSHPTDGNSNPSKKRKAEKIEEDRENYDDANVDSKSAFQGGKEKPIVDCDVAKNGPAGPTPKTLKKENSAEPRTAKAFSRVKLDEVEFVDDRLQDNSYWAKDGADTGYGAKAQEVLGQVRGRDFRHEKTKKKRGSYRGGEIDLQSHSIKFNYSDDE